MTRWRFQLFLSLLIGTVITVSLIDPVLGAKYQQSQLFTASHIRQEDTTIYKKTVLTVGYLTAIKGELKDRQGLAISGALTMALEEVSYFACEFSVSETYLDFVFLFFRVLFYLIFVYCCLQIKVCLLFFFRPSFLRLTMIDHYCRMLRYNCNGMIRGVIPF